MYVLVSVISIIGSYPALIYIQRLRGAGASQALTLARSSACSGGTHGVMCKVFNIRSGDQDVRRVVCVLASVIGIMGFYPA